MKPLNKVIINKDTSFNPLWIMRQAGRYLPEFREIRKKNPDFINELASKFGCQCVVVAIDAKFEDNDWYVYLVGGRVKTEIKLFDWAKEVENRGAGEILFTSMDHDGTKNGFSNKALSKLSNMVNIPVIASHQSQQD